MSDKDKLIESLRLRVKNLQIENDSQRMRISDMRESENQAYEEIVQVKDYLREVRVCGVELSLEKLETILDMRYDAGVVH